MAEDKDHIVVTVDIKHVLPPRTVSRINQGNGRSEQVQVDRTVVDVTHVVCKDEDLNRAIEKAIGHLKLELDA